MQKQHSEYESCILCHRQLSVLKKQPIAFRDYYMEGCGQLCYACYRMLFLDADGGSGVKR